MKRKILVLASALIVQAALVLPLALLVNARVMSLNQMLAATFAVGMITGAVAMRLAR